MYGRVYTDIADYSSLRLSRPFPRRLPLNVVSTSFQHNGDYGDGIYIYIYYDSHNTHKRRVQLGRSWGTVVSPLRLQSTNSSRQVQRAGQNMCWPRVTPDNERNSTNCVHRTTQATEAVISLLRLHCAGDDGRYDNSSGSRELRPSVVKLGRTQITLADYLVGRDTRYPGVIVNRRCIVIDSLRITRGHICHTTWLYIYTNNWVRTHKFTPPTNYVMHIT